MEDGFLRAVDILTNHFEFSASFDESRHPREHESHDGKKPGEFAEKPDLTESQISAMRILRDDIAKRGYTLAIGIHKSTLRSLLSSGHIKVASSAEYSTSEQARGAYGKPAGYYRNSQHVEVRYTLGDKAK